MIARADELHTPASTVAPPPSKTRRKQAMQALQDLGEALVALDPGRIASLDLPERLADAVAAARGMTRHEARRRQMQYIGRLMREIDAAPLEAALASWARGPAHDRERFAAVERWRDRVLADPEGLEAFLAAHPNVDRKRLTALVAAVRTEQSSGAPPRHFRELFRAIRAAREDAP